MSLNVGEFGIAFNLNVNYDITAATGLALAFTRADNTTFQGTPTVGAVQLEVPGQGTFVAGQYTRYVFKDGDLTVPGEYRVRLTYNDPTKRLISGFASFTVDV